MNDQERRLDQAAGGWWMRDPEESESLGSARVVEHDGVVVVAVTGEIDMVTAEQLADAVRLAACRSRRLVIDMAEMTFIDSSGLGIIATAYRELGQLREAIVLRSPNPAARRILSISGMDRLVTIEDSPPTVPPTTV